MPGDITREEEKDSRVSADVWVQMHVLTDTHRGKSWRNCLEWLPMLESFVCTFEVSLLCSPPNFLSFAAVFLNGP